MVKIWFRNIIELKFSKGIAVTSRHLVTAGKKHHRRVCQGLLMVLAFGDLTCQHEVGRTFFAFEADINGVVAGLEQQVAGGLLSGARATGVRIGQAVVLKSGPYTFESRHWTCPPLGNRGW